MRHARLSLAAAVISAMGVSPPLAADPAGWLLQVSDAARQANYQGVVVYRDEQMMEVLRIVHRHKDGRVQERLTSLTGKPRDILREGDQVACIIANEPVRSGGGLPQSLFPVMSQETLAKAGDHYQFRDLGEARVAGRVCRAVAMAPRDEFRYGYEVCADAATAVPLKVTLLDRQGRAVEQLMFTEVTFPAAIADAAFALPPGVRGYPTARERPVDAVAARDAWQLASLPPGFRVIMRSQKPGADGVGIVEHVLLSDGLSAVSVFGERVQAPDRGFRGFSRMGAMNAYGRLIGTFRITVVGEVPQSTVRLIGDGFRPAAQPVSADRERSSAVAPPQ